MKKGIHPTYSEIEVIKTNGETFITRSCLGAKIKKYHLELDAELHPAWTKKDRFSGPALGNVRNFQKRYPGLDLK